MITINKIEDIKKFVHAEKEEEKTVGFVPTMGYLHQGHLSLARQAKEECDIVIMSIFVNEKQFGPAEDYAKYPRDLKRDSLLAEKAGVDALFVPEPNEIYPEDYSTYVNPEGRIARVLCAKSRPGHFKGVCTVVAKLFNITESDVNYFGQKDYQQALILRKMAKDLNMNTEIKIAPTVREEDGLAMSSRNAYLSEEERARALSLNRALIAAENNISKNQSSLEKVKNDIKKTINPDSTVKIDYVEILDADNLEEVSGKTKEVLIALAVYIGGTRLIDNIILKKGEK